MSGLVVMERSRTVLLAEAVVREYLGEDAGLVGGIPWQGQAYYESAVVRDRRNGYPCPYCWISRGSLSGAAAHLLFWHRVTGECQ